MKNFDKNLREFTISYLKGNEEINEDYRYFVDKFIYFMGAYCANLNWSLFNTYSS
jgi:hypothetical protein